MTGAMTREGGGGRERGEEGRMEEREEESKKSELKQWILRYLIRSTTSALLFMAD